MLGMSLFDYIAHALVIFCALCLAILSSEWFLKGKK